MLYKLTRKLSSCTCFGSTYTKIGTIQRRLAWPLRKDDTQIREAFHIFSHLNTIPTIPYLPTELTYRTYLPTKLTYIPTILTYRTYLPNLLTELTYLTLTELTYLTLTYTYLNYYLTYLPLTYLPVTTYLPNTYLPT